MVINLFIKSVNESPLGTTSSQIVEVRWWRVFYHWAAILYNFGMDQLIYCESVIVDQYIKGYTNQTVAVDLVGLVKSNQLLEYFTQN